MPSTAWSAEGERARWLATAGLLVAVGAVLGLVESTLMPALPVLGVRIGLANIAVLMAMVLLGPRGALVVSLLRVILVGIATASLGGPAGVLAMSGAVSAWAAMALAASAGESLSVVGWSVAGAAAHVLGQLAAACVVVGSTAPLMFAPLSLALSLCCGLAIGQVTRLLFSRLPLRVRAGVTG